MTITYRNNTFKSLTHEQLDENFRDLRYDTNLNRVTENGNTTNISIRVDSIKANNIIASSVTVENISALSANTLTYSTRNPLTNENVIELPSGTKITGTVNSATASVPVFSRGNLINVAYRQILTTNPSYFSTTSLIPSSITSLTYNQLFLMTYRPLLRENYGVRNHLKIELSLSCSTTKYPGQTDDVKQIGLTLYSQNNVSEVLTNHGTHYFDLDSDVVSSPNSHLNLCATWNRYDVFNKQYSGFIDPGEDYFLHFQGNIPTEIYINNEGLYKEIFLSGPNSVRGTSSFTIYETVL